MSNPRDLSGRVLGLVVYSHEYETHILWWNIQEADWLEKVKEAYGEIEKFVTTKVGIQTAILLPSIEYGLKCVEYFESERNIKVEHVFENEKEKRTHEKKRAFTVRNDVLKISTIHSFKGWEAQNIIILIPQNSHTSDDTKIYTAITRTMQNLMVINASQRYWDFGNKYDKQLV